MKILFAGTPDFAVPSLQALIQSEHEVVGVLTQPDKPKGRGQKETKSPIKLLALENAISVYQPVSLKNHDIQVILNDLNADLMVVVAYGLLLPKEILEMFKYGCINVHASLLPKYRGASPIQAALLNGDKKTGVTIMAMALGMDTGDILTQNECDIAKTETSQSLHDKLALLGEKALLSAIYCMERNEIKASPQDHSKASYVKKIKKSDADIQWQNSATEIDRKIRAYYAWPVAYSSVEGCRIRIWAGAHQPSKGERSPGEILDVNDEGILVACGKGSLLIQRIQFPGGNIISIKDCLNAKAQLFQVGGVLGQ
jgi:methionyl-tRNA formyltransferase